MSRIIINGTEMAGVQMGRGFMDTLRAPLELKPFVENESRLEDGKRVIAINPKYASREISLEFQITGATKGEFLSNKDAFFAQLYLGEVSLYPENGKSDDTRYHLIYIGKSPTYSGGRTDRACKIKVAFLEPNPRNRDLMYQA